MLRLCRQKKKYSNLYYSKEFYENVDRGKRRSTLCRNFFELYLKTNKKRQIDINRKKHKPSINYKFFCTINFNSHLS